MLATQAIQDGGCPLDATQFDRISRTLGHITSRRATVSPLLGGIALVMGRHLTDAKKKRKK